MEIRNCFKEKVAPRTIVFQSETDLQKQSETDLQKRTKVAEEVQYGIRTL